MKRSPAAREVPANTGHTVDIEVDTARSVVTAAEINDWVDLNWDTGITLREWWERLTRAGYSQPSWPVGLGGLKASSATTRLISDTLAQRGVIAPPVGMGPFMAAPTIMEHGSPEQIPPLRRIANGEELWCQLFSEPEFGSDLAGVQTKAVRDGDNFIITGQKVWNSSANFADFGMLLARTNPDAPKHAGLTFFRIDMRQPGVDARPLKTMNGGAHFCEVFLTQARVRSTDVVGEVGDGWRVASSVLGHERRMAASGGARGMLVATPGSVSGNLDRIVADVLNEAKAEASKRAKPMINSAKSLIRLARQTGASADPLLRDALVRYHIQSEVYRLTNLRTRASMAAGKAPGPESSTAKIALSGIARTSRDLGLRIVGAGGMILGDDAASGGEVQYAALSTPGVSLGGGTDEIQRNVIAERALGLPRDPK